MAPPPSASSSTKTVPKAQHQSNLNAFFGGGQSNKGAEASCVTTKGDPGRFSLAATADPTNDNKSPSSAQKENTENNLTAPKTDVTNDDSNNNPHPQDAMDQPNFNLENDTTLATRDKKRKEEVTTTFSSEADNKSILAKRRRRVILDDDDDEEDNGPGDLTERVIDGVGGKVVRSDLPPKTNEPPPVDGAAKLTPNGKDKPAPAKDSFMPAQKKSQGARDAVAVLMTAAKKKASSAPAGQVVSSASSGQLEGGSFFKSNDVILQEVPKEWESILPYAVLCRAFAQVEAITGRLQIQEILTTLLRQIILKRSWSDLYTTLYLCSNAVAPAYQCVELGIGDAILIKAIGEATGTNPTMVKQRYETEGDLGNVAQSFKSKQRTLGGFFKQAPTPVVNTGVATKKPLLMAKEVLTVFREIAQTKGNQSQKWKVEKIKKLLVKATTESSETKYIIRGLQGKLRIGLAQSTVLISLAHALSMTVPDTVTAAAEDEKGSYPEEAKQCLDMSLPVEKRLEAAVAIVKKAYSEVPSYDALLDAALKVPLYHLHQACTLTPGIPVAPMLAKPTKSIQEVLKRLNGLQFTCEFKYDGERAQVHLLPDGTTKVFSRNLLDTSEKFPEVPLFVKQACKNVTSFVLDAEVVAFNSKTGQLVPFQILSTRKKTEESAETAKVQVIVQAFDLMFLNGESLLGRTLAERRRLMVEHFEAVPNKFQFAKAMDHQENGDTTAIEEFLDSAVKGQCEGLMIKTLEVNAIYEPSRRSLNWLKLKKDYLEGLGDSVDLVPLGAYHGRGKRTGVYGAYLLACYDPDTEEFQSVCKIGTGFSEEDLKQLAESLNQHKIPTKSGQYNVSDVLECDVWFDAVQVWEVKAADLSKSSAHRGADGKTGEHGRGIGLRFPRFERLRDDKRPEDATTSDQLLEMYYQQDTIVSGGGGDDDMDDDGI